MNATAIVPVKAKQAESAKSQRRQVDSAIWQEHVLAVLGNGIKEQIVLREIWGVHHNAV